MKLRISTVLLLVMMICSVPSSYSIGCKVQSPEEVFKKSSAVFVGVFSGLTKKQIGKRNEEALKFQVIKQWKGDKVDFIVVAKSELHGVPIFLDEFMEGKEYLIYAVFKEGDLRRRESSGMPDCSRNKLVTNSKEDFEYLDKFQTIGR